MNEALEKQVKLRLLTVVLCAAKFSIGNAYSLVWNQGRFIANEGK